MERLATTDLRRYVAQVTGSAPRMVSISQWQARPVAAVVIGTPQANALIKEFDPQAEAMGPQAYRLSTKTISGKQVVLAAGASPVGVVNAVYGLLRELGFRFYLGSEAVPESLPDRIDTELIVRKPVFEVRGVLPWYNFFNSPTTWDPIDHRAFADQLIRMGANFVGFHTYDSEPFAAYEEAGQMKWGSRLLNTGAPTWGTLPLPTRRFRFGTNLLFADDFFGAATTLAIGDAGEAIRAEQRIMRDALAYAHARGLKTCLGFEISGDPMVAADREVFLKRINHLLSFYPSLDYIWIWQPETQGAQGFRERYNLHMLGSSLTADSPLTGYGQARREIFKRIADRHAGERPFFQDNEEGRVARAVEGARLEQFAQLALRAFARRRSAPKLVVSGWGGDERLLSAEYYEGLDRVLPKDVVFASLDHIIPRPRVDAIYNELPPDRQRWPIPWLEYDGDQWHPQPFVHVYEKMVRDAHRGGSQGMLGIHWRTRDIEENLSYMVDYAWNPELSAEGFFKDLASHCYPPTIADQMAAIHLTLDGMGYRWIGGAGQVECGPFGWGPGEPAKVEKLRRCRGQIIALLPQSGRSRARVQWLLDTIDWVLAFDEAQQAAVAAQGLLAKAHGSQAEEARRLAAEALETLDNEKMAAAVRAFARRVTTRGEYGVLATINTKAVVAWQRLGEEAMRILGLESTIQDSEWKASPRIVLPRFVGSVVEGEALTLMPIVLGGAKAWAHYRPLGGKAWTTVELNDVRGWVRRVTLPAAMVRSPGIEIGFSFAPQPDRNMDYAPVAITVTPPTGPLEPVSGPLTLATAPKALSLTLKTNGLAPVEIVWAEEPGADFFKVFRDGKMMAETAVSYFPDTPMKQTTVYRVEAVRDGKVAATSEPLNCQVPDEPIAGPPEPFKVTASRRSVVMRWPGEPSPHVVAYRVRRQDAQSGSSPAEVLATLNARFPAKDSFVDRPRPGRWVYSVCGVNAAGSEGPAARSEVVIVEEPKPEVPVLDLPLTTRPAKAEIVGEVTFGKDGANMAGGFIRIPHNDDFNIGDAFTLAFDFRADSLDPAGMPVLLCHGAWQIDGWFVQILGGSLIVRTPRADANGPAIEAGKWYNVRFVYDGAGLRLSVNGQEIPQPRTSEIGKKCTRDLIIGQYETQDPRYAFHGHIRNVKIYAEAEVNRQ